MELLSSRYFPRIEAVGNLQPGSNFKGVTLLDGWLLAAVEGTGRDKIYT